MDFRTLALSVILASIGTAALAADAPGKKAVAVPPPVEAKSPFDLAFGAKLATDYNFRGVSQSDRGPSVGAYAEGRYNDLIYVGIAGASVDLPTQPSAEIDLMAGIRPTLGPVNFDLGGIFYYYPREKQLFDTNAIPAFAITAKNTDFFELYGKASYTFMERYTVGTNLYYAPDWLGTGADGTYLSATAKVALPYDFAVSGEFGHYWIGKSDAALGYYNYPDYNYWNAGVSYTYKGAFTIDLRYHDTDLSKSQCYGLTSDPAGLTNGGRSNWCGTAFIATMSVDLTLGSLK
jgi:uncharacterized protein (TIGR02001 family)